MAKPELGTKRIDPETGRKFYDLNREPIVSPYTGKSYPLSFFEESSVAKVLAFNPVSGVIEGWRWSLLGIAPDGFAIGVALAETVGVALLGWYVFGRMETRFSDYV